MALTDEEVARFRAYLAATLRGFLDSAAMTPSQSAATTLRAKAASYAAVLQMLDEVEGGVKDDG